MIGEPMGPVWMYDVLSPEREATFRQWARDNPVALTEWPGAQHPQWHPVIRDEWRKMREHQ